MATTTRVPRTAYDYTLKLTEEEAGYLYDLLQAHVGGELINDDQPLGAIRHSLRNAGVTRRNAHPASVKGQKHAILFRTAEAARAHSNGPKDSLLDMVYTQQPSYLRRY